MKPRSEQSDAEIERMGKRALVRTTALRAADRRATTTT